MNTLISPIDMKRIVDASKPSMLRTVVEDIVSKHFRSVHLLASKLVCDAIVLNVVLNDKITPSSADEIIVCIKRDSNSFYLNVDSAYRAVEDKFESYAMDILGEEYDKVVKNSIRTVNFIVYVMSLDVASHNPNHEEIYLKAYSYAEIIDGKLPHY